MRRSSLSVLLAPSIALSTMLVGGSLFFAACSSSNGATDDPNGDGGTGKDARWIDIREADKFDETQMSKWLKQAAAMPGWMA